MSFVDFEEVKANNPIEDVAQKLGLNLNKSGASLRGKCPVCESSGDRNLVITPLKNVYCCFSDGGKGGDQLQLVAHVRGCSVKEAALWLSGSQPAKEKKGEKPSEGFAPLDYLDPNHEAVVALGFEPEDADRIGIGYAPRGIMRGTVAVPIRDTSGKLLGYIGCVDVKLPPKWNY